MQRTGWSGNVTDSNTVEMNHPVYPKTLQWFFPLLPLQCWSVAIVMIPEMASFLNNELLPCQPASCTCIAMLSSKGTEDAIVKASDGSSCTLPASLKPQLLPVSKVRAALAARHRQGMNVQSQHGSGNAEKVASLSFQYLKHKCWMMWNMMLEPSERDMDYPDGSCDCVLNGCLFVLLFSA